MLTEEMGEALELHHKGECKDFSDLTFLGATG
jgi:hypothetical protein